STLLLAVSILLLCDVVGTQFQCIENNKFSVTVARSEQLKRGYASVAINLNQWDIDPNDVVSCHSFLCRMPFYKKDDCHKIGVVIGVSRTGCSYPVQIPEDFFGNAYAQVQCITIEGSVETEWIHIFIPAGLVAAEKKVEMEQKPVVQPAVKDAVINMKVTAVVRMQLTWNIEMRNGDPFMPSVLKSITVKRHHQISADDYDDGIVISNDINKHVIDDGLSPGYNFRWTCYLYSIDVTFQNGRHAYKEVERCFSLFSPSFVFLFGAISISIVLCIQFRAVTTEDTEHTQRALRRFRRLRI
ncbi:hypothetical protein V3C99_011723, partial [Haemonchus contortus]